MRIFFKYLSGITLSLIFYSNVAWASGLQAPNIGGNFVGTAEESVTSIYYNPAAIGPLQGSQVFSNLSFIYAQGAFDRSGSLSDPDQSFPTSTASGGAPTFFVGSSFDIGPEWLTLGLASYIPFAGGGGWGNDPATQYFVLSGSVYAIYLTGSASIRINPKLYVGAGLSFVNVLQKFKRNVDLLSSQGFSGPYQNSNYGGVGDVDGYGNSFGYNLGVYYKPTPKLSLGLTYHAPVNVVTKGDFSLAFNNPDAIVSLPGSGVHGSNKARGALPQMIFLGSRYQISPEWEVSADLQWLNWAASGGIDLAIDFDRAGEADSFLFNVGGKSRDGIVFRTGLTHFYSEKLSIRGGLGYDRYTVENESVSPAAPDLTKIDASLAFSYRYSDKLKFSFGYNHIFGLERVINNNLDPSNSDNFTSSANGSYKLQISQINVGVNYQF